MMKITCELKNFEGVAQSTAVDLQKPGYTVQIVQFWSSQLQICSRLQSRKSRAFHATLNSRSFLALGDIKTANNRTSNNTANNQLCNTTMARRIRMAVSRFQEQKEPPNPKPMIGELSSCFKTKSP
jgi:hypothetical protein